jgi:KUP system potassium uptake protein
LAAVAAPAVAHPTEPHAAPRGRYLALMSLGALGVVYGDIGTSPLYAMRECFHGPHALVVTPANVFAVLSLIFWSLVIVISIKYLVFVLRADNRGEGGILALMSLVRPAADTARGASRVLVAMGIFGAALLYGDGMITPAITVLGALEGMQVATPIFEHFVVPLAIAVLVVLFMIQRRGTGGIGAIFGPFMLLWFGCLAALGVYRILESPSIFAALNPSYAVKFFAENHWKGLLTLGSVFLVVTGGEALYADMGHFGRTPIRRAWFAIVLPALVLNYFGQGAVLLAKPGAAPNLFYELGPSWSLIPLVIISTVAASIASQAVISGAFSLTRQAVQLGYMPRLDTRHTSAREIGQIYVPSTNWALMIGTIGLVVGFRTSSNLAAAYGVAVTATMGITTVLLYVVARQIWGWTRLQAMLLMGSFLVIDLAFFGANMVKVAHGGWFPLLVAAVIFTVMTTWRRGRRILTERIREEAMTDDTFVNAIRRRTPPRVSGTAVFMDRTVDGIPLALLHNLKHNKVLHEKVVLLTIVTEEVPYVADEEQIIVKEVGEGIYRIIARHGFMEYVNVPEMLRSVEAPGVDLNPDHTTFFLGRETLLATDRPGMAIWREHLFAWMTRNAQGAALFFRLPPNRVVEVGAQIEL